MNALLDTNNQTVFQGPPELEEPKEELKELEEPEEEPYIQITHDDYMFFQWNCI